MRIHIVHMLMTWKQQNLRGVQEAAEIENRINVELRSDKVNPYLILRVVLEPSCYMYDTKFPCTYFSYINVFQVYYGFL